MYLSNLEETQLHVGKLMSGPSVHSSPADQAGTSRGNETSISEAQNSYFAARLIDDLIFIVGCRAVAEPIIRQLHEGEAHAN